MDELSMGFLLLRTTITRELQEKDSNLQKVVRPLHNVEGLYPKPSPPRQEGTAANFVILQWVETKLLSDLKKNSPHVKT